jgi:hypothetical protein
MRIEPTGDSVLSSFFFGHVVNRPVPRSALQLLSYTCPEGQIFESSFGLLSLVTKPYISVFSPTVDVSHKEHLRFAFFQFFLVDTNRIYPYPFVPALPEI